MITPAEKKFKAAVTWLCATGTHPTPSTILRELGMRGHNLNGRQVRWLREDMNVPPIRRPAWCSEEQWAVRDWKCPWHCCTGTAVIPSESVRIFDYGHTYSISEAVHNEWFK